MFLIVLVFLEFLIVPVFLIVLVFRTALGCRIVLVQTDLDQYGTDQNFVLTFAASFALTLSESVLYRIAVAPLLLV